MIKFKTKLNKIRIFFGLFAKDVWGGKGKEVVLIKRVKLAWKFEEMLGVKFY